MSHHSRPVTRTSVYTLAHAITYMLVISLCAPFAARTVEAAPASPTVTPASAVASPVAEKSKSKRRREGELIVRFRKGVSEDEQRQLLDAHGTRSRRRLRGRSRLERIRFVAARDIDVAAEQMRAFPAVELVEPNYLIDRDEETPNDPRFAEQWALKNIGNGGATQGSDIAAPDGWTTTTGSPSTIIAVIDSGIDFTHPDLAANRWTNTVDAANGVDDDGNGLVDDTYGWDYVTGSGQTTDEQGHGTAMAGIIAASGNNGVGISGVMWQASLMDLRVLDRTGTGDVAAAVEAIDYAVAHGARVINCSWGTDGESLILRDAIARAGDSGAVIITSAGNSSRDITTTPYYPASFDLPNIIGVAATDSTDQLTTLSNWSATRLTLAAPGANILTTRKGGGYQTVSGTSASVAVVSGVAGLVRTLRPRLRADRTRETLMGGVRPVVGLTGKVSSGGVVQVPGAMQALENLPPDSDMEEGSDEDGEGGNNGSGNTGGSNTGGGTGSDGGSPGSAKSAFSLPDLDEARILTPAAPKTPIFIHSDTPPPCDPEPCEPEYDAPPTANPGGPYWATINASKTFSGIGSTDTDGYITSYAWNFGDGSTGTTVNPSHTYTVANTYTVTLTVTDSGGATDTATTTVTVTSPQQHNAQFSSQSVPTTMIAGQPYNVTIRMRNTGTTAWETGGGFKLGSQNMPDNTTWRDGRVALPATVAPNQEAIFTFPVIAPTTTGNHNFQWRMLQEGVTWFGDPTPNLSISVSAPPSATNGYTGINLPVARLDAANRTGSSDLFSGNYQWSLPLMGLSGRAGMDMGLTLSYNSLVWTKYGNTIKFNADRGYPNRGFQLGFPIIQGSFQNEITGKFAYLLLMPSGERVELRHASGNIYESADSSLLRLDDGGARAAGGGVTMDGLTVNGGTLQLFTADGTRMLFQQVDKVYQCVEIKDRNGNIISATYDPTAKRLKTITDTLGRVFTFNYIDLFSNPRLDTITQARKNAAGVTEQYVWVRFKHIPWQHQYNFPNLTVSGPGYGSAPYVLTEVALNDGTIYKFDYNPYLQVNRIARLTEVDPPPGGQPTGIWRERAYTKYNLPTDTSTPQTDCPRFTERRDWAKNWNGDTGDGVATAAEEAVTTYGDEGNGIKKVTTPDGKVIHKEFFITSGWGRGLTRRTETVDESSPSPRKWTATTWTQDDESLAYMLNPRVTESTISDNTNTKRTRIEYTEPTTAFPFRLPQDSYAYDANQSLVLKRSHTEYMTDAAYTSRRIIGLVREQTLYDGAGRLASKVDYVYDEAGDFMSHPGSMTNHDTANYGTGFVTGRGNATSVRRWDVNNSTDETKASVVQTGYNTAGATTFTRTPPGTNGLVSQTNSSYADKFSDETGKPTTFAYPTTVTDPAGKSATATYSYGMGVVTKTQTPHPTTGVTADGPIQTSVYDAAGRMLETTNSVNGAYTRWKYPVSNTYIGTYTKVDTGYEELYSWQVFDGAGRVIGSAKDHRTEGATKYFSGQLTTYNVMGQATETSNPTEMDGGWQAAGDDAVSSGGGWKYTKQTYDWKGRPLVTTHVDNKTRAVSYEGCGCAGGEGMTLTDEVGRKQKVTSDVLGRVVDVKDYEWNGTTVYRMTTNSYNTRDQITQTTARVGEGGTVQTTTTDYDGHGRVWRVHTPIMDAGKYTTTEYNPNDTVQKVTDARNASATFAYNSRGLASSVTYQMSGATNLPNAAFDYDAVGNRLWMTDSEGRTDYSYDTLSRLKTETRQLTINGTVRSYPLAYDYNLAGELKSVTDPFTAKVNYIYDKTGKLSDVTGATAFAGVTNYATGMKYRAWGAIKSFSYGSGQQLSQTYDARLRLASFQVGSSMSSQYQYYDDGKIKYAKDLTDAKMDRAYQYDNAGRISEGLTGGEARNFVNGTTNEPVDGIYRQTYQYDVWNSLTGRFVFRFWSGGRPFSATYTNSRRSGSSYDAAGHVTGDAGSNRTHTYDAAGRQVGTWESSQRSSWAAPVNGGGTTPPGDEVNIPQGGHYTTTVIAIALGYDGDGRSLKRVRTTTASTPFYQPVTTTVAAYYVRSSVMGGQIVTELNSQGNKDKTSVYAGGKIIAEQNQAQGVVWHQVNPVTGSKIEASTGGYLDKQEYDPFGLELGDSDPYLNAAEPDYAGLSGGSLYRNGGNPFDPAGGCSWNGAPIDCRSINFIARTHDGATLAVSQRVQEVGSISGGGGGGGGSYEAVTTVTSRSGGSGRHPNGSDYITTIYSIVTVLVHIPGNNPGIGTTIDPQTITRVPFPGTEAVKKRLNTGDCNDYIASLIAKAADLSKGKKPAVAKDGLDLLGKINNFVLVDHLNFDGHSVGGTVKGGIAGKDATVLMSTRMMFGKNRKTVDMWQANYINTAIHEMLHLAGYDDTELALAASKLPGASAGLPSPPASSRYENGKWVHDMAGILHNSGYWDTELQKHCGDKSK